MCPIRIIIENLAQTLIVKFGHYHSHSTILLTKNTQHNDCTYSKRMCLVLTVQLFIFSFCLFFSFFARELRSTVKLDRIIHVVFLRSHNVSHILLAFDDHFVKLAFTKCATRAFPQSIFPIFMSKLHWPKHITWTIWFGIDEEKETILSNHVLLCVS